MSRRPEHRRNRTGTPRHARDEIRRLRMALAAAERRAALFERLAGSDPLTGLLNRRGFERGLERALAFSRRYGHDAALLFFDLDDFKIINDTKGHSAGDAVLVAVASTLADNVRRSDIVARVGGDEFIVLLWNASPQNAAAKAELLRQMIEADRDVMHDRIAVSVGMAGFHPGDNPASLIARADAAMYQDKSRRKGRTLR